MSENHKAAGSKSKSNVAERNRLQLDFSPEAYSRLLQIREMAEARTNAEVVRNALRVYEWFLEQKKENARLQVVKDGTVKEIELLF